MTSQILDAYDVVVVGGGAAGLNGAMMLGRSRRSVLVVDAGRPRNRPAAAVHGHSADQQRRVHVLSRKPPRAPSAGNVS